MVGNFRKRQKLHRFIRSAVLAVSILMVVIIVGGCSSRFEPAKGKGANPPSSSGSSHEPANGLVQSDTGGSVTIDVEGIKEEDGTIIFDVAMNTHSVDLDTYDLGKLAILRDDAGGEYRPISWDSAPGGHHRRGRLGFSAPGSLSQGKATYLELVIQDVAEVKERVFRWELR